MHYHDKGSWNYMLQQTQDSHMNYIFLTQKVFLKIRVERGCLENYIYVAMIKHTEDFEYYLSNVVGQKSRKLPHSPHNVIH